MINTRWFLMIHWKTFRTAQNEICWNFITFQEMFLKSFLMYFEIFNCVCIKPYLQLLGYLSEILKSYTIPSRVNLYFKSVSNKFDDKKVIEEKHLKQIEINNWVAVQLLEEFRSCTIKNVVEHWSKRWFFKCHLKVSKFVKNRNSTCSHWSTCVLACYWSLKNFMQTLIANSIMKC